MAEEFVKGKSPILFHPSIKEACKYRNPACPVYGVALNIANYGIGDVWVVNGSIGTDGGIFSHEPFYPIERLPMVTISEQASCIIHIHNATGRWAKL
jgi:hypothetical protein